MSSVERTEVDDRVTDRVMQEALRRSNEELDALVANAPLVIYKLDTCGRVLMWNAAAERTFGWSAAEVVGRRLPIVASEDLDAYLGRHLDCLEGNGHYGDTVVRRHRDGRSLSISLWTSTVHDEAGEAAAVLVVAADVTEKQATVRALADSERRFRTMVQNISDTVTVVDEDGRIQSTTDQINDVLGYPPGWWHDRSLFDLAHPDDLGRAREKFYAVRALPGRELKEEFRARHCDGSWAVVEVTAVNLLDDPAVNGIVITARNVTRTRRIQRLLAGQASVLETVASGAGLDETFRELTAMIHDLMPGVTAQVLVADGERLVPRTSSPVDRSLERVVTYEVTDPRTGQVRAMLALDPQDTEVVEADERVLQAAQRMVAIAIERHQAQERLVHQGLHDQLTGLPNRVLLVDRLDRAVTRARQRSQQVAVLLIDIDRFKVINESLGHAAGDQLLTAFSERLRSLVRPEDTVARFGGDEFVVVCDRGDGPAVILSIAERLERSMDDPLALPNGTEVFLTVSMGMAANGDHVDGPALLRNADAAMYRAKELGRSRLEVFDDAMRASSVRRLTLGNDLRRAVERAEFVVHYQPVMGLDGSVHGAEALVRWQHPERGLLPPSEFIAITEETGLVTQLGEQVLEQGLEEATRWRTEMGLDAFTLSVNLSARQLAEPGLTGRVEQALDRHGVAPRHLCLELTESVLMEDLDHVHQVLTGLKDLGIRLAIDDFGTGWSSLTYLHRFPVDEVKIDQSFVRDLGLPRDLAGEFESDRRHGQAIVDAVLGMAHALDLQVVAEGVEHQRQLDCLDELGCDFAQGFLFSVPLPADRFADYLRQPHPPADGGRRITS